MNRDLVTSWCRAAQVQHRLDGKTRKHVIVHTDLPGEECELILSLDFLAGSTAQAVAFTEEYRTGVWPDRDNTYRVSAPLSSLDLLVAWFERNTPPGEHRPEDRLIARFEALVAAGELGDRLPRRRNRDRVAGWFTEAGATVERSGFARTERLLKVHRTSTDCHFELNLKLDAGSGKVTFSEEYDYTPRSGDAGREYTYGVRAPYASLETLVAFFESRLAFSAEGDPEERLGHCFRVLVERGELADGLPLRAPTARVTGWFTEAGVPVEPADSHWISTDWD